MWHISIKLLKRPTRYYSGVLGKKRKQTPTVPKCLLSKGDNCQILLFLIFLFENFLKCSESERSVIHKDPITPYLLRLLELVPHSMNFTFNEDKWAQQWHQIMPTYSWIGSKLKALHGWPHGRKELVNFIKYLNDIHEKMKFTSEVSSSSINFLDTTIKVDTDNNLYTTLYEKPTDTHLYFHYDSALHGLRHTKGPHGQFLRLRRICTRNEDFIENGINMLKYYFNRGFPFKQLKKHMLRACKITQDELLEIKTKEPNKVPGMTTKFNPSNPEIKKYIHHNWIIIKNSSDSSNTFSHKKIIGFKRLPNLRDMLTSTTISYPPKDIVVPKTLPTHCTRLGKCTYCPIIKKLIISPAKLQVGNSNQ